MALNQRAIRQRITSVKNTQKMTRAMEMVSAAKMRKAVQGAVATRLFAKLSSELLNHLAFLDRKKIIFLQKRKVKNTLVILMTSNRGLCGSYNANVIKKTHTALKDIEGKISIVGVGKKSALFAKRYAYDLPLVFDDLSERPEYEEILPIAQFALNGFTEKQFDQVYLAYTKFYSPVSQEVKLEKLVPLAPEVISEMAKGADAKRFDISSYVFEPTVETIADTVLPKLLTTMVYQAILNAAASEHSSRMMAMKNATESAKEMVKQLTLTYNKARQAAITQEISEIVGGAAALE